MNPPSIPLMGTPLLTSSYESFGTELPALVGEGRTLAIEFANTQIVVMRRHDPEYRQQSQAFDYFLPDGMPLVWCLNRAGAKMRDRVYGPTFMRTFLTAAPESTHYLLGGSEECGRRLREKFSALNPRLKFVGSFHGKCNADGILEDAAETQVIDEINSLSPDYIWIGLGAPKQQQWIRRHKTLIRRGAILSVGFAFDVNAGMKPDAPLWMQRYGLTWVFRLWSEPRRLGPRYLRYNFLFLFYLLWDGMRGRLFKKMTNAE